MAIDEKDVAKTIELSEGIDRLGESVDAERRAILGELKSVEDDIRAALLAKDWARAAAGNLHIAHVFRARHFLGEADRYRLRAEEITDEGRRLERRDKRTKRKGGQR